jgi:hypothetical protein
VATSEQYETYRVQRKQDIIRFVTNAIERSGGRVLEEPSPSTAPFPFRVQMPSGEVVRLLCYAFRANRYRQGNRPPDEHRFQVKYGSDFRRYHHIHLASAPDSVTLMFGVHLEKGLFIAVDPAMHEVTWFSKSVEFKEHDLEAALSSTWHSWERERVLTGRRVKSVRGPDMGMAHELLNAQDEALLAFTPEKFLKYAQFERVATGLPTGERLLIAEKLAASDGAKTRNTSVLPPGEPLLVAEKLAAPYGAKASRKPLHPLEVELGLNASEILDLIDGAFRLKVAVRGNAAERHLLQYVADLPGVTDVASIDEDGRPDLDVQFRGRRKRALVECKTVGRRLVRGHPKVDFQKTRATQGDPCNRYYRPSQFDILAACLHSVTEEWEFRFCGTQEMDPHSKCAGRLDHKVYVHGDRWGRPLTELLDALTA